MRVRLFAAAFGSGGGEPKAAAKPTTPCISKKPADQGRRPVSPATYSRANGELGDAGARSARGTIKST